MKTIASWNDLLPFGIDCLTGEACGLGYRLLCDVTAKGKKIIEKCLGIRGVALQPNWNPGKSEEPSVGSIMLAPQLFTPLAVFALLENGCTEVWLYANGSLLGIEPTDTQERIARRKQMYDEALVRTFAYRGTAGDRNVHQMSGRIE